jgi:hypothetical protein
LAQVAGSCIWRNSYHRFFSCSPEFPNVFLHKLGWQVCSTVPNYWLRWGLKIFLARAGFELWSSQSLPPE